MASRASRIAQRFASVAESVNDHSSMPNRRVSSEPTHCASSVGSIVVIPPSSPILRVTAATVGQGVPGHGAGVAEGEVDVGVAVDIGDAVALGLVEVEGKPPLHMFIHVIGTRPKRLPASSKRARLRGWCSRYAACSAAGGRPAGCAVQGRHEGKASGLMSTAKGHSR